MSARNRGGALPQQSLRYFSALLGVETYASKLGDFVRATRVAPCQSPSAFNPFTRELASYSTLPWRDFGEEVVLLGQARRIPEAFASDPQRIPARHG